MKRTILIVVLIAVAVFALGRYTSDLARVIRASMANSQ